MSSENQNAEPASERTAGEQPSKACTAEEMAAEAVRLAKLELDKAEKFYEDLRRQAAEKLQNLREKKVGELVDCTLETVKKHPGSSLVVTAALGFCMGRWIQKILGK
jgi:ElaB/YqjD/DUF883 family membrane-anchored ribosome-binding protein